MTTHCTGDQVLKARGGVIETPLLETIRSIAGDITAGRHVPELSAELFVLCIGPLLDELVDHRRRAAQALDLTDNVIPFRGA